MQTPQRQPRKLHNRQVQTVSPKERIYRTAGKLFSEIGYHATSMRDLAKELGLQGGSLYTHITSKEELLLEIVMRAGDEFENALAPVRDSKLAPTEKLRAALEAHLEVIAENLDWCTVFFHEWKHLSSENIERINERRDQIERIYRDIIAEGVRGGSLRKDLDVKLAATLALSSANWSYHWFKPSGKLSAREVAERFVEMLLAGFVAKK